MKKLFNEVIDINGKKERYPAAEDGSVFFFTEDRRFCIYALYTKKDLSERKLIEVTQDTYDSEIAQYISTYNHEPTSIFLNSIEAIQGITTFVNYKATVDNMSIEDLYNLNHKGD